MTVATFLVGFSAGVITVVVLAWLLDDAPEERPTWDDDWNRSDQ